MIHKLRKTLLFSLTRHSDLVLRRLKPEPASLVISLTNRCNCRCVMCGYWRNEETVEVPLETLKRLLREGKELGVKSAIFYGGEPMLREDIIEVIRAAKAEGLRVKLVSNGTLIAETQAQELVRSGLDAITLSMDCPPEVNDDLRGAPGCYEKSASAVVRLREERAKTGRPLEIQVSTLLVKPTLDGGSIPDMVRLCKDMGVRFFLNLPDFNLPYHKGSGNGKDLWIGRADQPALDRLIGFLIKAKKADKGLVATSIPALRFAKQYFDDPRSRDVPCLGGLLGHIWVNCNGDVHTCSALPPLGNIAKRPLADIVGSEGWAASARRMFRKNCPGCSCYYPLNVETGMSYLMGKLYERNW